MRQEILRRRNLSLSEKLKSHRYHEMSEVERNFENAKEMEKKRNCEMKTFYQQELAKYNE